MLIARWIAVHILPVLAIPALLPLLARRVSGLGIPVLCLLILVGIVAIGQALTVPWRRGSLMRWAGPSALGLVLAFLVATLLGSVLESQLHVAAIVAVALAHAAGGCLMGVLQAPAAPRRIRGLWQILTLTGWLVGSVVAYVFYAAEWMPGRLSGAFFGRIELTTLVRLLPMYAAITAPLLRRAPN